MVSTSIETRLFINGKFRPSSNNETFDLLSARSGSLLAKVYEATKEDVDDAVAAAKAAAPAWAGLSPYERGRYLVRLADLIVESNADLAHLEAESMGRPVSTYFDATVGAKYFRYFSEAAYPQGGSSLNTPGFVNITLKQPVGVVAAIIPWNAPLVFFCKKLAPALAAGNAVVLKSSEKAPLTSLYVAALAQKAGFPPGVLNVLSGHGPVSGAALASHMDVRALSFTGSNRTGRLIAKMAFDSNMKNLIFELGGKAPAIIFNDADIDAAVRETQFSIQIISGQTCMANSRIYVQRNIAETFLEKFKAAFTSARLGDPTDPQVNHGPQADKIQHATVLRYIELGKKTGKLVTDEQSASGLYINPTIFTDVPEDAQIMKDEIFGPVVIINTFDTEAEAVANANNTEHGLYASVYTKDLDRAMRVASRLEAGTVGVNCTGPTKGDDMPFGGQKGSGVQRESYIHSIETFMETKSVLIKVIFGMSGERLVTTASSDTQFDAFATRQGNAIKILAGTRTIQAPYDISVTNLSQIGLGSSGSINVHVYRFDWNGIEGEVDGPVDLGMVKYSYASDKLIITLNPPTNSTAYAYEFSGP